MIDPRFVTSGFELPGYRIVSNLGIVRGIVVRSRSVVGNFGAQIQTIFGGNITIYTELCEKARLDANAVVSMRYDATEMMPGITEVLCYGTAVVVQNA
jgi:uncharacterized protein YbjQ (UPF0145 family)